VAAIVTLVVASVLVLAAVTTVAVFVVGSSLGLGRYHDVPSAEAGCQPDAELPVGPPTHLRVGQRIPYPIGPPAGGPHWGNYLQGVEVRTFYSVRDRPAVERLVHSLEHGYTILWYDESVADNRRETAFLRALSAKVGPKFIVAPWTALDGPGFGGDATVVLTHWSAGGLGIWGRCERLSSEAVKAFVRAHPYQDSLEPNAP
jgi:hypothetical protein